MSRTGRTLNQIKHCKLALRPVTKNTKIQRGKVAIHQFRVLQRRHIVFQVQNNSPLVTSYVTTARRVKQSGYKSFPGKPEKKVAHRAESLLIIYEAAQVISCNRNLVSVLAKECNYQYTGTLCGSYAAREHGQAAGGVHKGVCTHVAL